MKKQDIRDRFSTLFVGVSWGEDFIERLPASGSDIWAFVSALRGPDSEDTALKNRTTWRIRSALAPEFFISGSSGTPLPPDKPGPTETDRNDFCYRLKDDLKKEFPQAQLHFLQHYAEACWSYWKIYGW
jgi:hypothetical protein